MFVQTGECSNSVDTTISSVIHPPSEALSWISSRVGQQVGTRDFPKRGDHDNVGTKREHTTRSGKRLVYKAIFLFHNGEVTPLPVFTSREGYGVSFTRRGGTGGSLGARRCLSVMCVSMRKESKDEG